MTKQTTRQVTKALGISTQRVYSILGNHPHLRPSERVGKMKQLLWSEEEIAALRAHLLAHPYKRPAKHTSSLPLSSDEAAAPSRTE